MNKNTGFFAAMILGALFLGGCGASTGLITDANAYKAKQRCDKLDKDLIKVDRYIEVVSNTDAFHMEEMAVAIQEPDITTSTNKKQMLKDANTLRDSLIADRKKFACK